MFFAGAAARLDAAEPPHISFIERLGTNQVTIHFEAVANRTYTLQFVDNATGTWSNLWVAPRLPFPEHYVIADYKTNRMRMYRLRVTP